MQFERRPSQRYARRQSHVLRERQLQQRDKITEEPKNSPAVVPNTPAAVAVQAPPLVKIENEADLIILDNSHEDSTEPGVAAASSGMIVGLAQSPKLHAKSLMKSPLPVHKSQPVEEQAEPNDAAVASASAAADDHRFDVLIKNLAKETLLTNQLEEINEKEKIETTGSKLNTIHIPNNHVMKTNNHSSAKPLLPDQLKCNILKGN